MHKRMIAKTEVAMQTARIGLAKVTGLLKLDTTPGGGGIEGIIFKSTPGGSETAILGYGTLGRHSGRDKAMEHQTRQGLPFDSSERLNSKVSLRLFPEQCASIHFAAAVSLGKPKACYCEF